MQNQLNETFSALSDPTRRAILERLTLGEATAGELAEPFGISKPAISRHLKVLEHAKLIVSRKDAQWRYQKLSVSPLKEALAWLDDYRRFWESGFDALEMYLEKTAGKEKETEAKAGQILSTKKNEEEEQ